MLILSNLTSCPFLTRTLASANQSVAAITEYVVESRQVMETRIRLRKVFNESCEHQHVASPHLIEDDLPTCVSEESLSSLDSTDESSVAPTTPTTTGNLKRVSREYYFDQSQHQQQQTKRRKTELAWNNPKHERHLFVHMTGTNSQPGQTSTNNFATAFQTPLIYILKKNPRTRNRPKNEGGKRKKYIIHYFCFHIAQS